MRLRPTDRASQVDRHGFGEYQSLQRIDIAAHACGIDVQPGHRFGQCDQCAVGAEKQPGPFRQFGLPVTQPALMLLAHAGQERCRPLRRACSRRQRDHR